MTQSPAAATPPSKIGDAYRELASGLLELAELIPAAGTSPVRTIDRTPRASSPAVRCPAGAASPMRSFLEDAAMTVRSFALVASISAVAFQSAYELFPPARPSFLVGG